MHLRHGEAIMQIVKRHRTPFIMKLLGILVVIVPLYVLLFQFYDVAGITWVLIIFGLMSFFIGIIVGIVSLDYTLDKLILTNRRIVWVNWRSLFHREEKEIELLDIQDVEVRARGILSQLPGFNYGTLVIETSSSKTAIRFADCPHPEKIEHHIISQTEAIRNSTPMPSHVV